MIRKLFAIIFFPGFLAAQPAIDSLLSTIEHRFDATAAYTHVKYFSQFWRVAGGRDFNLCIAHIESTLTKANFSHLSSPLQRAERFRSYYIQEKPLPHPAWEPKDASLRVVVPAETTLQRYTATAVMLCKNSFPIDTVAELIDVGKGISDADFDGKDARGKIVLGSSSVRPLFRIAVAKGAIGVVSSLVRPYNHPEIFPDIISEEEIPYDEKDRSFGLKISSRSASYLKTLLTLGPVKLHISVSTSFAPGALRTLVAEIPGTERPDERVIFIGHLDHYKPGANDNASGSATLTEMAATLATLISKGAIAPPKRTMTFIWVDEYNGTYAWIAEHKNEVKNTVAVFNLDMTGEDCSRTGGQFWMERTPDPASIWLRPPDKHTEWGSAILDSSRMLPTWLNDFYFSILEREAARTGWTVGQHPFEGGSDHEPFLQEKIPAVTSWHFTDYFYHSSMDDTDKVSPLEMKRVGTAALAAGWMIATPGEREIQFAVSALRNAATWRLLNEGKNSKSAMDSVGRGQHEYFLQRQKEKEVLDAWTKWYEEAFLSLKKFPTSTNPRLDATIEEERMRLDSLRKKIGKEIGID